MERTAVNPWGWSLDMGYNQGEVVSGHTRTCSAQGRRQWMPTGLLSTPATWPLRSRSRSTTSNVSSSRPASGSARLEATAVA